MNEGSNPEQEGKLSEDLTLLLERLDLIVQRLATAVFLGPAEMPDGRHAAAVEPAVQGEPGEGDDGGASAQARPAGPCPLQAPATPWL